MASGSPSKRTRAGRGLAGLPDGTPKAGLVVVQEIFGVNPHIRSVADRYAALGYAVLAPAFFDPVQKDVELGYGEDGFARPRAGRQLGHGGRRGHRAAAANG
jgi:dienelactone hydrolase